MTSHKLLKINVITDRGDGVPPRPHPGVRMRAGLGPFNTGDQPLPTSSARIQLLGIDKGHHLGVNPHRMGRDHPTMQDTAFKQSLADGTEVCGTRLQVLDLGAYFVRHGRNPIILRLE